jgi:hypothetical protein
MEVLALRQLGEEPREGGLVGYGSGDSTGPRDEGVVLKGADQFSRGLKAQDVLGDEAAPESRSGVSLGATARGTGERVQQGSVVEVGEGRLKLPNDGRRLNRRGDWVSWSKTTGRATFLLVQGP